MAINLLCTNHPHYGYITVSTSPDGSVVSGVTTLRISRKVSSGYSFIAVYTKSISTASDLELSYDDYLCRNNTTYQYRVEYLHDNGDTFAVLDTVAVTFKSTFDVLVLIDRYGAYYTPLNAYPITYNTIKPYAINTPILSKKPSYYSFANTCYREGNCQGTWLKMTGAENNIVFETDNNWEWREEVVDFLCQPNSKLLKSVSGEMWIVGIKTDTISDSSLFSTAEVDGARLLEFGWIEIGDANSEADLNEAHLINVPRKYWCSI